MAILLSDEEIEAMQGVSYFLRTLYIFAIRRYMDYQTGIVGIKRRISYQSLIEEMYVEPHCGIEKVDTGSPVKAKIRRALARMEKVGLIEKIKNKEHIVFRCVLARRDYSVQNQVGTKPAQQAGTQADTIKNQKKLDLEPVFKDSENEADTQVGIPKPSQVGTPPLSGKDKEKEILRISKKKRQLPENFEVTEQHCSLAQKNNWPDPKTEIDAFKDYHLSKGTLFVDWDRAFYTWLRNAARFRFKERTSGNNQPRVNKPNSFNRAIENIINSATRSR